MSDGLTKSGGLRYRPLCHVVKTDSNRVIDETKTYLETNGIKALIDAEVGDKNEGYYLIDVLMNTVEASSYDKGTNIINYNPNSDVLIKIVYDTVDSRGELHRNYINVGAVSVFHWLMS